MISKFLCLLSCAVLLSGCLSNRPADTTLSAAANYLDPEEFSPPPRFTSLFAEPRPVLDIEFVDLGVAGKLILEQRDGPYSRYLSSDLGGIVLQRGLLHCLFGFGEPLAASNLSGPMALILNGRAGAADRFHTYLNGENREVMRTYRCSIAIVGPRGVDFESGTVQTTLVSEDCQSLDQSFQNLYWVDRRRGEVIQSKQWVGDNVGSIVTRVTYP